MNSTQRPSRIEIDLEALRHNIKTVKSLLKPGARLMAVVKADAYGHGAVNVSRAAEETGVDYLGVAFLEEAQEIRESGVRTPIVILYPETIERNAEAVSRGFHISVSAISDLEKIKEKLGKDNPPIKYFITVNTGMNRYGLDDDPENIVKSTLKESGQNGPAGFNTNMADPLMSNETLSRRQVERFLALMRKATEYSRNGLMFSHEASGSLWENGTAEGSLVRVGLLLYGIPPDNKKRLELKPVMSVKSRIAEIHNLHEGDGVGYGFSYIARRYSRTAVIPMGYADGYPWSLSNKGAVIVRGKTAQVIGRVCMDAFMVDVTDIKDAQVGDETVILGSDGDAVIDASMIGEWAGSFAYEIVSGWSKRLPRIYR